MSKTEEEKLNNQRLRIVLTDYLPSRSLNGKKERPEKKPVYVDFLVWSAIISIIDTVSNNGLTKESTNVEKEALKTVGVAKKIDILCDLQEIIDKCISLYEIRDRHSAKSRPDKPCKCSKCNSNLIEELEKNIIHAATISYLWSFQYQTTERPRVATRKPQEEESFNPGDYQV